MIADILGMLVLLFFALLAIGGIWAKRVKRNEEEKSSDADNKEIL